MYPAFFGMRPPFQEADLSVLYLKIIEKGLMGVVAIVSRLRYAVKTRDDVSPLRGDSAEIYWVLTVIHIEKLVCEARSGAGTLHNNANGDDLARAAVGTNNAAFPAVRTAAGRDSPPPSTLHSLRAPSSLRRIVPSL